MIQTIDPNQFMHIVNRAYFAGIVDGEGSIGIELLSPCKGRKKDYYVCRLTVINTDEQLMKDLVLTFKGSYDQRKLIEGRKPCFRWHVFGKNLKNALQELYPFLRMKQQQARLVLKYIDTKGKTGWLVSDETLAIRKELWLQCKELNSGHQKKMSSPLSPSS